MTDVDGLDLGFLDSGEASAARRGAARRRSIATIAPPVVVVVAWAVWTGAAGHLDRVADHVGAAVTMVFGSLVAGSTPQGGGAVAFPVFTKGFDVGAAAARTFSLCIQAVGMGLAAATILLAGRRVAWRAVAVCVPVGVASFAATLLLVGDAGEVFWPSRIPGAYVKVTFTLVVAAMAWVVLQSSRLVARRVNTDFTPGSSVVPVLVVAAVLGGVASALVGSGLDVFVYLAVVVLLDVDPRVGVPTSVVTMAAVSLSGLVILGLLDGQLSVQLAGDAVATVGGEPAGNLTLRRGDIYGMWLAAVPVVAVGAPTGAWIASRLSARTLMRVVVALAAAEVLTTVVFLDELRSDVGLVLYGVLGLAVGLTVLGWLISRRDRLFGVRALAPDDTLRRSDIDVTSDYGSHLRGPS